MNLVFLMKTSKEDTSREDFNNTSLGCSGFTLLELVVSLTIMSMVVLVLYQAFSLGTRVWDRDDRLLDDTFRLEASLRMMEEDMIQAVPYNMTWQEGEIQLFSGGPRYVSYVTGNGKGAFSGAGAGLFFSTLFMDDCPDESKDCLYLFKAPKPSREFVETVHDFRTGTEFQRQYFSPGPYLTERAVLILKGVESLNFSYSRDEFFPFAGLTEEHRQHFLHEEGRLSEEEWVADELPGQLRLYFILDEQEYVLHVPVGK